MNVALTNKMPREGLSSRLPTRIWVATPPTCGGHLFFCLLGFIIWYPKAKGPTWGLSHFQPYPNHGGVWKMVLEKASQNTLGHVKLGSKKTQVTKTLVDTSAWPLYSPSKYQLLILDPNSGKFPSQGDRHQRTGEGQRGGHRVGRLDATFAEGGRVVGVATLPGNLLQGYL